MGHAAKPQLRDARPLLSVAIVCSMLPDIDVIGFRMGVHYGDLWGHRGMTHSLLFSAIIATGVAIPFGDTARKRWYFALLFFLITASHSVLDALTNGGLGVAFFSPFSPQRYFFPVRPIAVSPIGASRFFSARGMHILSSEAFWIWIPTLALTASIWWLRQRRAVPKLMVQAKDT